VEGGIAERAVDAWFLGGFGALPCEPSGVLNLKRYLPIPMKTAHLPRRFEARAGESLDLALGFSDELCLMLDDKEVFTGQNTLLGMSDRS